MEKVFSANILYVNYEIITLDYIISSFQFLNIKFKKVSERKFHFHCIAIYQICHLQMHQFFSIDFIDQCLFNYLNIYFLFILFNIYSIHNIFLWKICKLILYIIWAIQNFDYIYYNFEISLHYSYKIKNI